MHSAANRCTATKTGFFRFHPLPAHSDEWFTRVPFSGFVSLFTESQRVSAPPGGTHYGPELDTQQGFGGSPGRLRPGWAGEPAVTRRFEKCLRPHVGKGKKQRKTGP